MVSFTFSSEQILVNLPVVTSTSSCLPVAVFSSVMLQGLKPLFSQKLMALVRSLASFFFLLCCCWRQQSDHVFCERYDVIVLPDFKTAISFAWLFTLFSRVSTSLSSFILLLVSSFSFSSVTCLFVGVVPLPRFH